MKILAVLIILVLLISTSTAELLTITAQSTVMDNYVNDKAKFLNNVEWGDRYESIEANFYLIIDDEPYLIQVIDGKVKDVKSGVPNSYDYKITTTTKNADKWWKIVEYYFEHDKLTCKQKYWDIPWLLWNTDIEAYGNNELSVDEKNFMAHQSFFEVQSVKMNIYNFLV